MGFRGVAGRMEFGCSAPTDDGVVRFLRVFTNGHPSLEHSAWWHNNKRRVPPVAAVAKDLLDVQSSSMANESSPSWAGNLISAHHSSLEDEVISACL